MYVLQFNIPPGLATEEIVYAGMFAVGMYAVVDRRDNSPAAIVRDFTFDKQKILLQIEVVDQELEASFNTESESYYEWLDVVSPPFSVAH